MQGFLGELIGTMTLILLGNGVVAGVSLKGSYAENGGWIVITTGWGLAVICAVIVALAVGSNAHLNPAVHDRRGDRDGRLGRCARVHRRAIPGCRFGAVLVWLHYLPHWSRTDNAAGKRACFCTSPAVRHMPANVLAEIIGTFVLVFVAAAISSDNLFAERSRAGLRPVLGRPARVGHRPVARRPDGLRDQLGDRDLGPRIAHALLPIAGKGSSGWDYARHTRRRADVGGARRPRGHGRRNLAQRLAIGRAAGLLRQHRSLSIASRTPLNSSGVQPKSRWKECNIAGRLAARDWPPLSVSGFRGAAVRGYDVRL